MNLLSKFWALALSATVFGSSVAPALADQHNAIDSVQSATQVFSSEVKESENQIPKSVLDISNGYNLIMTSF